MLGVTMFGIFLTPVFYYVIQWWSDHRQHSQASRGDQAEHRIDLPPSLEPLAD
jgi:hypothetical protein